MTAKNMSHVCNLNFSSRHILKSRIKTGMINFNNNVFYLAQYIKNIIILTCDQYDNY